METKYTLDECKFNIAQPISIMASQKMYTFSIKATPYHNGYNGYQIPADRHISMDIKCNDFSGLPRTYRSLLQMGLPYELPNKTHDLL